MGWRRERTSLKRGQGVVVGMETMFFFPEKSKDANEDKTCFYHRVAQRKTYWRINNLGISWRMENTYKCEIFATFFSSVTFSLARSYNHIVMTIEEIQQFAFAFCLFIFFFSSCLLFHALTQCW